MRVQMVPGLRFFRTHESGIKRVAEAYHKYLPEFGIEIVPEDVGDYDIKAVHAGMAPDCDVAHLHGMYWTADYEAARWEWKANAHVIGNLRMAKEVTVPSEWVAKTIQREMRFKPHVIGHGLEWDEWADHRVTREPYIIWNKNRNADVCDPWPMSELAKMAPGLKFLSTFAPPDAPSNVEAIGLQPYEGMKMLVQGAAVYLSTTKETFGIGILEAMAAGIPVLGFAWGNIGEFVEHEVNGWLSKPGDFEHLREGLDYCWENMERLGDAGREMARGYEWRNICEKVAEVYRLATRSEDPTVAVIIPAHNYAQIIGRAVESAMGQTCDSLTDIVVVDDGSQDGGATEIVVSEYAKMDDRVRYIRQENQGVAAARNNGIAAVGTKYVCCLDADDAIQPGFLEVCVDELQKDRTLGIAFTGLWAVRPDGTEGQTSWPDGFDFERQLKRRNQVPTCCVFRRKAWERLGGYRSRYCPQGAGSEDAEFWTRIGAYGWDAKQVTKEPLFVYSLGSGHVTKQLAEGTYEEPDWLAWHPWVKDRQFPFAAVAEPKRSSHPVRSYDAPWVSVIIPVGPGHQEMVIDALDSLEAQTFRQWECVLVNDTGEALPEWLLTAYPYMTVVETPGAQGAGYARNRGAEVAKAPFLVFLDADDHLQSEYLQICLQVRLETERWVYTDLYSVWQDGTIHEHRVDDFEAESLWKDGLGAVTSMHSKAEWEAVGGFDETMETREDWDFHMKLVAAGYCGTRVAVPLMTYRLGTGGRREKQATATAEAMRQKYSMEVLMAGCGKCGKAKRNTAAMPQNWNTKEEEGFIQLEYTGKNRATTTYKGSTGRPYRFGNNDESRIQWVHPEDADYLMNARRMPFKKVPSLMQTQRIPGVLTAPVRT